jgi:putative peptidoglycan lipid II flippase
MSPRRLLNATLLIGFFFSLEKVGGLVKQVVAARLYGVGPELDAFNAANNLPDTLYTVISGGALAVAFIPLLSAALERDGRPALWELFSRVANLALAVTGVLSLVIALFALPLVQQFVVPKFSLDQQLLVADLMRLNLLATMLFSFSGLIAAGLQANQHFFLPALAPVMYDLGQLLGLLFLGPVDRLAAAWGHLPIVGPALTALSGVGLNLGIYGFAYGTVLGAALYLLIQLPGLARYGFRWTPQLSLRHPGVRQVLRLMGPRVLTVAGFSAIFILNDNFASGFETGAVTALAYGWLFMQVPQTLIGTAGGIALLPTLSEFAAAGRANAVRQLLRRALLLMTALTAPITLLAVLALPFVTPLVFGERAGLVNVAGQLFMLGLVGHSLKEVTARAFYAHRDAWTPLATVLVNLSVYVLLALALTPLLSFAGLALANSLSFTVEAGVMLFLLWRRRIL